MADCIIIVIIVWLRNHHFITSFTALVDVYHKYNLVTKAEARIVASDGWRWREVAVSKNHDMAVEIADTLYRYGVSNYATQILSKLVAYNTFLQLQHVRTYVHNTVCILVFTGRMYICDSTTERTICKTMPTAHSNGIIEVIGE